MSDEKAAIVTGASQRYWRGVGRSFDLHTGAYQRLDRAATSIEYRMKMTAKVDTERFQSGVSKYAAYLETPEGRLRSDLAFANLQDFLPVRQGKGPLLALDLGAGTGATAVRLARLGLHVTLLDSSPPMLELAKRTGQEAGVTENIVLKHQQDDTDDRPWRSAR